MERVHQTRRITAQAVAEEVAAEVMAEQEAAQGVVAEQEVVPKA